jgi:hypothetical protein
MERKLATQLPASARQIRLNEPSRESLATHHTKYRG